MFKIALTAAALSLASLGVQAAPTADITAPANPANHPIAIVAATPVADATAQIEDVAYYCEWATVYDYWGNWITVWQCY
ncbi:hypothetical protein [Pararhodobacter sp.]|uniref:hypothetical protein n=1 Tax=Pararhodobacter sp. TaxID=2127056 RepID=UPI002AFF5B85|nr:hypothetical protein [Pararhodobacter sp.]